jgi:hypothetical protein
LQPRDVPRLAINLKRGDAAAIDEVESLLQRARPAAPAPAAAPAAAVSGGAPPRVAAPRALDPEATALLDQAAVRAAQEAVAREQAQQQQQQQNRVASRIHGRGAVQSLDD